MFTEGRYTILVTLGRNYCLPRCFFCFLFSVFCFLQASPSSKGNPFVFSYPDTIFFDLQNPTYEEGILSTSQGGVVQGEGFRIQAQNISYYRNKENRIEASTHLIFQHKGKIYVGESMKYDLASKTGWIVQGKTFFSPFFFGGESIVFFETGEVQIEGASITTSENKDSSWYIKAKEASISCNKVLHAKDLRFYFFPFPLWLPSFYLNLKKFEQPIIQYNLTFDKATSPRPSIRAQIFSLEDFLVFLRAEYRIAKGFGGALETSYLPSHANTKWITKSYLASDILPNDLEKKRRYRLQGEYRYLSPSNKTKIDATWDKYSDVLMPGDFRTDDFEINTAYKTEFALRHQEKSFLTLFDFRPKVNSFYSMKEKLPSLFYQNKPLVLGDRLQLFFQNQLQAALLRLSYSDDLSSRLSGFQSGRSQVKTLFARHFFFPYCSLVPELELTGVYYTNNPQKKQALLGSLNYRCLLQSFFFRNYSPFSHWIYPYLNFEGKTSPTIANKGHFIFSIEDGFERMFLFQSGVKNQLFFKNPSYGFLSNLYFNAFVGDKAESTFLPKLYFDSEFLLSSFSIFIHSAWNFPRSTLDFCNLQTKYTLNENAAFSVELRYRSQYDWRKSDHTSFILDVARKERALLDSPLSDKRMTLLTNFFFRLSPFWTCHVQSHHGLLRKTEPSYHEFKIDLFTPILTNWKLRLSYMHTQTDDRIDAGLELVKK